MSTPTNPFAAGLEASQQQSAALAGMRQQQGILNQAPMQQALGVNNPQNAARQSAAAAKYVQDQTSYLNLQKAGSQNVAQLIPDWIKTPAEWVGSKMYWAYSHVISRPISTAFIANDLAYAGGGSIFSSATWDRAYQDAAHVSPGQVAYRDLGNFFNSSKNYLTNGNNDGTIIWDHPDQVQQAYHTGTAMFVSGGMDAGLSWFADPAALGGKLVGGIRAATYTKPLLGTANPTFAGKLTQLAGKGISAVPGGETVGGVVQKLGTPKTFNNIQAAINSSTFVKMGDTIEKAKAAYGDRFPEWVTQQKWAQQSATANGLANVLAQATDRTELDQVLRIAMGDPTSLENAQRGQAAANALLNKNAELAVAAKNADLRYRSAKSSPQEVQQALKDAQAIDAQAGKISDQLEVFGALKNGLYFNNQLSPALSRAGQAIRTNIAPIARADDADQLTGFAARIQRQNALVSTAGRLVYNNLYARPILVFGGALGDVRPNGWVNLNDVNSHNEVRAELQQSKAYSPTEIQQKVSQYITTPTSMKPMFLKGLEQDMTERMAARYGLNQKQARVLYGQFDSIRGRAFSQTSQSFSPVTFTAKNGTQLPIDRVDAGGNTIMAHPVLTSQLADNHVFMDTEAMDRILKYNGRGFAKLIGENPDMDLAGLAQQQFTSLAGKATRAVNGYNTAMSIMNTLWKFNTLFRLGYGPRAIGDDFLSQIAQFGGYQYTRRAASGLTGQVLRRNMAMPWYDKSGYDAKLAGLEAGIAQKTDQISETQAKLIRAKATTAQSRSGQRYAARQAQTHQFNLDLYQTQLDGLNQQKAALVGSKARIGDRQVILDNGQVVPAAFQGPMGALYHDLNTGRRTMDVAMGGVSADILAGLRNQDWRVFTPDEEGHVGAWARGVNDQIMNDPAAKQVVLGATPDELRDWMVTAPEGRLYWRQIGLKTMTRQEQAERVFYHVNHYLPTSSPELVDLRTAVAQGASPGKVGQLMSKVPENLRPSVSGATLAEGLGKGSAIQAADRFMSGYYKLFNELPVDKLSRSPLFAQIYEGHVQDMARAAEAAGHTVLSPEYIEQMSNAARRLALQDVKRFTFNMDAETKLTHAMRTIAPFFGPTQEAYRRWGRIVADKPEVLARNALIYSSPSRGGYAVDQNGEPVIDGYAVDPTTGKKYLVPKNEIHIQFQMPHILAGALDSLSGANIEQFGPVKMDMPLNTFNMVMRDDPWYNPGYGPWVQVAANHWAKSANPQVGDLMKNLGILPYGISKSDMDLMQGGLSRQLNQDDTKNVQLIQLQLIQDYNYQVQNGLLKQMPSWKAIQDQAQHWADLKGWLSGTNWLPVSSSFKDPYQYFRDAYHIMQQQDPKNADANFYKKFGSSAYAFTQSLYKNNYGGLPATADAMAKIKDPVIADFISQNPELAAMVTGTYNGKGFSQTAWQQQVNAGMRTQMTAQQAWDQAQVNLGWQQYNQMLQGLKATLYQRGLTSFSDPRAKDLNAIKKAGVGLLSNVFRIDSQGNQQANPFYNQAWTQAYNSFDPSKGDRQALALSQLLQSPTMQKFVNDTSSTNPRKDLQGLAYYLNMRAQVQEIMAARKSTDINARSNASLREMFTQGIFSLMESNTQFEDLHDRFLQHDMFDHYATTQDQTLAQIQAGAA